ncbi:hypothetical protein [Rubrolithibacter danxiaensis]|uniref:hypothetical protein n=1 Tax=Rubrolithibacter danxiaensis TaxID=3390805 RepID=UPI003BF85A54
MRIFILLFLFSSFYLTAGAQNNSAYELQRKKVNGLLEARSSKFGQYDESLTMHTGIFGLKTKKDMQRSIDILRDIVQTDNAVFKELKILLDYKDLEKKEVQTKAEETGSRISKYMQTITKLQAQNDKLQKEVIEMENKNTSPTLYIVTIAVLVIAVVFLIIRKN